MYHTKNPFLCIIIKENGEILSYKRRDSMDRTNRGIKQRHYIVNQLNVGSKLEEYAAEVEQYCRKNDSVDPALYDEYGVNLGLRDKNGNGVRTGLTNISKIVSSETVNGEKKSVDGKLWYRGYAIEDIIENLKDEMGFEKVAYLLIFGEYPDEENYLKFKEYIGYSRVLPTNFTRDVIMKAPTEDIMNSMMRSILTLASYDKNTNSTAVANVIRQSIQLIGQFPLLAVYGYNAFSHYEKQNSMFIHNPDPELSTAENLLMMLREDKKYTRIEAKTLDTALILHMEHGGGNNSTFTTRVVTSSGSDTYSTIAAAMSSLKGPRHGGANIKVMQMIDEIRNNVRDFSDEDEIYSYLEKIVNKEAFDRTGLIYGMGHAVYSLSDPRERIFRDYVAQLAVEKNRENDFMLFRNIEKLAPVVIGNKRKIYKGVCPNIDFYSGFVYEMLGIPREMFTAVFSIARIVGWSAHRIEELICMNKIIRPAYISVMKQK